MIYRIFKAQATTNGAHLHEVEIMAVPFKWLARILAVAVWWLWLKWTSSVCYVFIEESTPDNALVEWGEYRRDS